MTGSDVTAAFWEYERALMDDDLPALDAFFAPGPDTLRGDAAGVIVGHDAISAFRLERGGAPARRVLAIDVHEIDDGAALVVAVTAPVTGGRGQQTQLWRRIDGRWQISAAHVSAPRSAIDSSVWRVVGTPLVEGARGEMPGEPEGSGPGSESLAGSSSGSPAGSLAGETVAVKDLFSVAGHAIGGGVPAYLAEALPAQRTSSAVQALLDAGADVAGIARTDEFAYSIAGRNPHYGTPPNPAVVGGTPGGSSSGPASAVALGQASIGLGTDTGGSIRVPASYQALWGLRTTFGAVGVDGVLPLAPSFDTAGWLTRSAPVLRRAATATLDLARQVPVSGYVTAPAILQHVDPAVGLAFEAFTDELDAETVDLGDIDELFLTFRTVQSAEAWRTHGKWIQAHPGALGDDIASRFAFASTVTAEQEAAARETFAAVRSRLDAVLGDRVLLLPSASSVALPVTAGAELIERTRQGTLRLTAICGLTGRPGLSVPLLWIEQPGSLTDAPVGLCLVGPRFSDLALIDAGERLGA